jgi:hypothetical protein
MKRAQGLSAIRHLARGLCILSALACTRCAGTGPRTAPPPKPLAALAADSEANREWEWIRDHQLGVDGFDPESEYAGCAPAKKFGFKNWYPNSPTKCTLCGDVPRFEFFDGLGNEADWNVYIAPHDAFKHLLCGRSRERHDCVLQKDGVPTVVKCMEAEVTPRRGFYDNPWFPRRKPDGYRPPSPVCVYGPWVSEMFHGYRPEIHPAELLWWRDADRAPDAPGHLLLWVQDGSTRFDLNRHYGWVPPKPWRPWASHPKIGRYRIAYETTVDAPAEYWTRVRFAQGIVSSDYLEHADDAGPGARHVLTLPSGQVVAIVNEEEDRDDELGVTFSDPFVVDGKVRGYVQLTSALGVDECGGYLAVEVTRKTPPLGRLPSEPPTDRPRLAATPLDGSLRMAVFRGEPQLVTDIEIRRGRGTPTPNADARGAHAVDFVGDGVRTPLRWDRLASTGDYRIRGVPIFPSGEVVLSLPGGREAYVSWEGTGFLALPLRATPVLGADDSEAVGDIARALGADRTLELSSLRIRRVERWEVEAESAYSSLRDGKPSPEDESPWAEQLTDLLEKGNPAGVSRLFGTTREFSRAWSGVTFSERTGLASEDLVRLEVRKDGIESDVRFSPRSEVRKALIEVTVVDPAGHRATATTPLWSHVVVGEPRELTRGILRSTALRAELDAGGYRDICDPDGGVPRCLARMTPAQRRRVVAATVAHQAAQDGVVTLLEMHQLWNVVDSLMQCEVEGGMAPDSGSKTR